MELSELAALRERLKLATAEHASSIGLFYDDRDQSFARQLNLLAPNDEPVGKARRLTTTLTCYESLFEAQSIALETRQSRMDSARLFAEQALGRPGTEWKSDGSASVYCRVRALAPIYRLGLALSDEAKTFAQKRLTEAWKSVAAKPDEEAIYEFMKAGAKQSYEDRYPPNAYLSDWGMASLNGAGEMSSALKPKRLILPSWFEKSIATQIALQYEGSVRRDPQQLCWSICGALISSDDPIPERRGAFSDLIAAGLRALFAQQLDNGDWPLGAPLFHYAKAGNAYCYIFETFGELMYLATRPSKYSHALNTELRPYSAQLVKLVDHAMRERRPLSDDGGWGWSSGHHPHRNQPESWATASVYRYLQRFRRLVGMWARSEAKAKLGARPAEEGLTTIIAQGDSWDIGHGSTGLQLTSLFVHPILARPDEVDPDPDQPVLQDSNARSAILYGPPGTGKTTLVEAVAGALGWAFIEILPAQFLDRGVDFVSARADEIFDQLMELDRCVILFDEIDELIRSRDDKSDPIERFFTTTMLPKVAKLWKQKRVLFFVNTNAIDGVDKAIRRNQRFDAAIYVLPPSLQQKRERLGASLSDADAEAACRLLKGDLDVDDIGVARSDLGWLGLIRFDQLDDLETISSTEELIPSLKKLGDRLLSSDWLTDEGTPEKNIAEVLQRSIQEAAFQRWDRTRVRMLSLESEGQEPPAGASLFGSAYWKLDGGFDSINEWAAEASVTVKPGGIVKSSSSETGSIQ